ncbi:MAG: stage III sporulation protein AF, partial [Clostridia bacterium]
MVTFFSKWAQGIIVAVIIATIIEMILPNGTSKKYVKVVIGIYILFTIISPVIDKFSNGKVDFNQILAIEEYEQKIAESDNSISQKIEANNSRTIKDIYTSNLETDIKSKLKEKGYGVSSTYIKVKDDENYTIERIILDLYKKEEDDDSQEQKSDVNKV